MQKNMLSAILGMSATICSAVPALAHCPIDLPVAHMPEIDGGAGVSALAVLISAGLFFYNKARC